MKLIQFSKITKSLRIPSSMLCLMLVALNAPAALLAASTPTDEPLTSELPEYGYGFFKSMSTHDLTKLWGSDNPGLRNLSALESVRRIWLSDDPVEALTSLMPRLQEALKSSNPNERRAVADFVAHLWKAGGMRNGMRVRIRNEVKDKGIVVMRKKLGVLLPTICKNVEEDPHMWARTGAVDLAGNIIAPKWVETDSLYEKYSETLRPLLLLRCSDNDKFMQLSAGRALNALGIEGLEPATVVKTMTSMIETGIAFVASEAFQILRKLDQKDLLDTAQVLIDAMASDSIEGGNRCGIIAGQLLLDMKRPEAPKAVIDYVTRDRYGNEDRCKAFFPVIREFSDAQLLSAIPELKRFALMEEVRGRRAMEFAEGDLKKLEKQENLKPTELVQLDNAKKQLANPPHEWVMKLFDRIGEPRPEVGKAVTGHNPLYKTEYTSPPWVPENVDEPVALPDADGLVGNRAMDLLPLEKGKVVPIEPRAFSSEEPETNCANLIVQMSHPENVLRRPLGPTGIMGTFSARRILVVGTQPGSPAHEKIQPGDWILGVNGRYFTFEPSIGMAWAIEESEGRTDGSMNLNVLRNGKTTDVTIHLQPLGRHVDTWPYGCEKSDKLLKNLCEFIVRHDARYVIPAGLVLLASGDEQYMPEVRREVYEIVEKGPVRSNWFTGYKLILLSEYYQKTGDSKILPAIERFAEHLSQGQTFPGAWLHNASSYNKFADASKIGYGELNMAGIACLTGMVLANECEVTINNTSFNKAIDYFKIFSGRGIVPYGAMEPYVSGPEAGGKTAVAGVAFDLLGRGEVAKPFVTMSGTAYEYLWEGYHGGSFWSAMWRPLGTARDSKQSFKRMTSHNLWRFNLSRHWNGGMTSPKPDGGLSFHHMPTRVAAFGMIYSLPRKAIRLTGAPRSVFSRVKSMGLEEVKQIFDSGDDAALHKKIQALRSAQGMSKEKLAALDELLAAAESRKRLIEREQQELDTALQKGDFYKADQRMTTMRQAGLTVPEKATSMMTAEREQDIKCGEEYMKIMFNLVSGPTTFEPKESQQLAKLAQMEGFYGKKAKAMMEYYGVPADGVWPTISLPEANVVEEETIGKLFYLISPSLDEVRILRMKSWMTEFGEQHPLDDLNPDPDLKDWTALDYDDSTWPEEMGPFIVQQERGTEKLAHVIQRIEFKAEQNIHIDNLYLKVRLGPKDIRGTIYLNGEAIVEFPQSPNPRARSRGHRRLGTKMAFLKLPPRAKELMREGRNVLCVRATLPTHGSWSHAWMRLVDVGLGATKIGGGSWRYDPMVRER